jgi:hypothetical protein
MTNFYLITTFVILLADAEAVDKATSGTWYLPDHEVATSWEGWLASQRPGGLGRDVRVVYVCGVESHLRAKSAELTEQAVDALVRGGQSRLQDPEVGMI